jgi:hypothetical protein
MFSTPTRLNAFQKDLLPEQILILLRFTSISLDILCDNVALEIILKQTV